MKKVLKTTFVTLGGALLGVAGFYLYVQGATTATPGVTVSVPGTLSITDNTGSLTFSLTPSVINTSNSSSITVASNSGTGFTVTAEIEDLDGTSGQLCNNNTGACGALFFDTDGTSSYISVQSDATGGTLDGTFVTSETKLGATPVTIYTDLTTENPDTFRTTYDGFADYSISAASYEGVVTLTITSL